MTKSPRLSIFLKTAALNLLFLSFLVGLLEVVFGRWFRNTPTTAIPEIARTAGRSYKFRTFGLTGEDVEVVFERDNDGLRGRSANGDKPLILVLGGSTGVEQNVPLSRTWPETLESLLKNQGHEYDVVNASVSGHTLFGNQYSIANWLSKIPLKPKLIIIYYGHNDAVYTMNGIGPAGRDFSQADWFDLKEHLLRKSAMLMLYREVLGNYQALVKGNSHLYNYRPAPLPSRSEGFPIYVVPSFLSSVRDLSLVEKAVSGIYFQLKESYPLTPVVFVAQSNPNCRFLSDNEYLSRSGRNDACEKLASLHVFVRNYLAKKNDADVFFIPLYLENPYDRYGASDSIHTNSKGSIAIANALAPYILEVVPQLQKEVK